MREEATLLDGVPIAVVPASETTLVVESRRRAGRTITAGLRDGDLAATGFGLAPDGRGSIDLDGTRITVPLRGEHNVRNALLALAVARECGISIADAGAAISAIDVTVLPQMRSTVTPLGSALMINDAYNSNPGSARAALALLVAVGAGRQRVAVLGTMRELGAQGERAHREIAHAAIDSGVELIAGIGDFAAVLSEMGKGQSRDARVITASDVEELWPLLAPKLAPTAAILLKASRGVRLERLVPLLSAWADGQGH